MDKYFERVFFDVPGCEHKLCQCYYTLTGRSDFEGFSYTIRHAHVEADCNNFFAELSSKYTFSHGQIESCRTDPEVSRFLAKVPKGQDFTVTATQLNHAVFQGDIELMLPSPLMRKIYRQADVKHFEKLCNIKFDRTRVRRLEKTVWIDAPHAYEIVPTLRELCLQHFSMYKMAYTKTNGNYHAISALSNLYPHKWADNVLKQVRPVHTTPPQSGPAMAGLNDAIEYLYHHLGTRDKWGTIKTEMTFDGLEDCNFGTSAGLNNCPRARVVPGEVPMKIGAKKKLETFEADMKSIFEFLTDDEARDLFVAFNNTGKNEVYYSRTKQIDPQAFADWKHKCRLFVIPSSVFVLLERMVGKLRQMLERIGPICIGMKWSRGGMDVLAKKLKIDTLSEWLHILVEGDVANFDQSVWERFIDLYFSFGLVYDEQDTPEYKMRVKATKFLIRTVINRLTHMFGQVWGFKTGGMPSGIFNTSHGDSWIMLLWFFLFGVFQIHNAPEEHKETLENALLWLVAIIVYGDDHVYNKTNDPVVQKYFSGYQFAEFMQVRFGVEIRGLRDGISFLSSHKGGILTHKGMIFCRQHAVKNPYKKRSPKQPDYLPFRESFDFFVRAGWGRDVRIRGPVELMLSCVGHAYGTFASNRIAYDGLHFLYETAFQYVDCRSEKDILTRAMRDFASSDLQEMRRRGIDASDLANGFPSWDTLVNKNEYDEQYHVCDNLSVNTSFYDTYEGDF